MNRIYRHAVAAAALILVAACANNDVYLRPERTTFMKLNDSSAGATVVKVAGANVALTCLDWKGNEASKPLFVSRGVTTETSDIQCLYVSVEVKQIADRFDTVALKQQTPTNPQTPPNQQTSELNLKVAAAGALPSGIAPDGKSEPAKAPEATIDTRVQRNLYYSFLRNIADQNCQTFLGRSFANKASIETARSTFQDLLTGGSAAVASAAPPAAAGLSLVNLFAGKTIDNINSTFYYEKTFQAMAGAIAIERERIKREIDANNGKSYDEYTIFDLMNDMRRYDDACSVRVGVTKLQELAQEKQAQQRQSSPANAGTQNNGAVLQ